MTARCTAWHSEVVSLITVVRRLSGDADVVQGPRFPCVRDAGYFERFNLTVPREPAQWDAELGGDPFPAKSSQASMQWSKASSTEISALTGQIYSASTQS